MMVGTLFGVRKSWALLFIVFVQKLCGKSVPLVCKISYFEKLDYEVKQIEGWEQEVKDESDPEELVRKQ